MSTNQRQESYIGLVQRAQQGDARALDALLEDCRPGLARFASSLLRNVDAAQDVVQETLIKLATNLSALEAPAAFRSWAHTILRREVIEYVRRQSRGIGDCPSYDELRPDQAPPAPVAEEIEQIQIDQCLRRLQAEDRKLLRLHYWWGFEVKEIAPRLGIAAGAVKTRLFRARSRLREQLCSGSLPVA